MPFLRFLTDLGKKATTTVLAATLAAVYFLATAESIESPAVKITAIIGVAFVGAAWIAFDKLRPPYARDYATDAEAKEIAAKEPE